jgi:hypothetical protein
VRFQPNCQNKATEDLPVLGRETSLNVVLGTDPANAPVGGHRVRNWRSYLRDCIW